MECATKGCKWKKGGRCLLFAGQTILECRYRTIAEPKNNTDKKRKESK